MESESCYYHLNIDSIVISTFNHRVSIHNVNLLPAPPSYIALLPLHSCEVLLYRLLDSQALLEPLHQFLFIWWHLAKLQLNSCSRSLKVCFQRASSCLVPISHVFFQLLCLQQLPSSTPSLGNLSSKIIVVLFLNSFPTQFTIVCKYNLNISIWLVIFLDLSMESLFWDGVVVSNAPLECGKNIPLPSGWIIHVAIIDKVTFYI